MSDIEERQKKSLENALGSIKHDELFPSNVFRSEWKVFFFFESDELFCEDFISAKDLLIHSESSHTLCLLNLSPADRLHTGTTSTVYLDSSTNFSQYISTVKNKYNLMDNGSPISWFYLRDEYVCASEIGEWCIYCERMQDVAVIAFKNESAAIRFTSAIQALHAVSISMHDQSPPEKESFHFNKLTETWRSALVKQYLLGG